MKIWKTIIAMAAACFAGGFGETTAQETLDVHYTDSSGTTYTLQVEKNVEVLEFVDLTSLTLPKGLTKLHTLEIDSQPDGIVFQLTSLNLPKDIGKDADWPFRLVLGNRGEEGKEQNEQRSIPLLAVHKDMRPFLLMYRFLPNNGAFSFPIRIPAAKDLIRNREPDDDGVFRIDMSHIFWRGVDVIEVHGVAPRMWLNRQEGGVEIVWDRGQLQSAPSIDGPWTDITFDDTRRLFLRSSSPAEFFRVKP